MPDSTSSLREQLGARPDPEFELVLPRGWERTAPTHEAEAELERRASRRFMESGGADAMTAFAQMRRELRRSMQQMREQRVVALFAPTQDVGEWVLPFPTSIIATFRGMPSTQHMDGYVKNLIVNDGARPLDLNRAFLRVESERTQEVQGESLVMNSTLYVTPVPGSSRRRALELLAVYGRPGEARRDDADVEAVHAYLDAMVSTLRWQVPTTA